MELNVTYQGGAQFAAHARGHTLITDQPADNGGTDAAMTPPELLLASLGTCAAHYAVEYLKARSLSTDGLRVRVTAEKKHQPARLADFRVEVEAHSLKEPRHYEGLLRSVKRCLVHNTLLDSPHVETAIAEPVTMG
jgi:putative redox protein